MIKKTYLSPETNIHIIEYYDICMQLKPGSPGNGGTANARVRNDYSDDTFYDTSETNREEFGSLW